uniref:Slc16a-12 n=1 Tax=Schmidtea mediterranea TaxID=79327 RepID=A0A0H3YF97_SCHMD|nr:slc16a-12 [Schmidtea mediterranea]
MPLKTPRKPSEDSNATKIPMGDSNIKIVNYVPYSRWRWVVLFSAVFIKIVTSGIYSTFGLFMKQFIQEFQRNESTISWMVSIHSCLTIIVAPLATYLALKFGHRIVVISGLIVAGISFSAPYFYSELWFIFLSGSVLNAIGQGLVNTCSTVLLTNYFQNNLPIVLGIHASSSGLAPIIVNPVIRILLTAMGWRMTRLMYGTLYLISICFALTFKPVKRNSWGEDVNRFHLTSDASNQEVQLIDMAKKSETGLNNYFGSQTSRICSFISTANIASNFAHNPEIPNAYSSNYSIQFNNPLTDIIHANKDLVNININTLMGMSVASNLHIRSIIDHLPMMDMNSPTNEKSKKTEERKENTYVTLFRNPIFLLFLLANLFTHLGYDTNFVYAKRKALEEGISDTNTLFIPMSIGFGTILGRLIFGYLGSRNSIKIFDLFTTCLILSGCCSLFSLVALTFPLMLTYSMVFGLFIGGYSSLNTAVLSSIVPIYNFKDCLFIIYVVQAIGLLFGAPVTGYIYDYTKTFWWPFLASGSMILVSGLVIPLAYLSKKFKENQEEEIR